MEIRIVNGRGFWHMPGMNRWLLAPLLVLASPLVPQLLAQSPPPEVTAAPRIGEARVEIEQAVIPADQSEIKGTVEFRPSLANADAAPDTIRAFDAANDVVGEATIGEDGGFTMELEREGLFVVRPVGEQVGWQDRQPAMVFRGDWQEALSTMQAMAEPSLAEVEEQLADASGTEKAELERRAALLRFAEHWLAEVPESPGSREVEQLAYLVEMLRWVARGEDYLLNSDPPSHLAMIECPEAGVEPGFVRFWIHLPADYHEREAWPLSVFLHGSGKPHETRMVEAFRGPIAAYPSGADMPCIALAPQSQRGPHKPELMQAMVEWAQENLAVDPKRISIVGHSRGGSGVAGWASRYPDLAAVVVPMSSGLSSPIDEANLAKQKLWIIYGENDESAFKSGELQKRLAERGADAVLSVQPGGNHMSVFSEFDKRSFWEWVTAQERTLSEE